MEKEIIQPLVLDKNQQAIVDMHSLINILNIIVSELYILQINTFFDDDIEEARKLTESFAHDIYSTEKRIKRFHLLDSYIRKCNEYLDKFKSKIITEHLESYNESRSNLRSVFEIMKVRIAEILERMDNEENWKRHSIQNLINNFINVFSAIEKNSKGRYKIVYFSDEHDENSYLVDLKIESHLDDVLYMPPIFQDVFRDLIANARKYTPVGGSIRALLKNDGTKLLIEVEDNGIGIPDDQIDLVVKFGFRADNVSFKETKGGGFGLTKAYHLTKRLGGRLWIDSEIGHGTLIRLEIPAQ